MAQMRQWMIICEDQNLTESFFEQKLWWLKLYGGLAKAWFKQWRLEKRTNKSPADEEQINLVEIDRYMHRALRDNMRLWQYYEVDNHKEPTSANVLEFISRRKGKRIHDFTQQYVNDHPDEYTNDIHLTREQIGKILGAAVFAVYASDIKDTAWIRKNKEDQQWKHRDTISGHTQNALPAPNTK